MGKKTYNDPQIITYNAKDLATRIPQQILLFRVLTKESYIYEKYMQSFWKKYYSIM
jgi:hypothetical protein